MTNSPGERDPVEVLAEEFVSRSRRSEAPSISEYVAKHPQYARQIEELFPAVAMMEELRTEEKASREAAARRAASGNVPKRIGDFEIIREIGRGGMGIVYEAEQQSLARRVAVKVLPKHLLLLDKHLKRFRCEAQTAAGLHHTNIVPVFGVGDQDGLHYYVMPLVRGVGLDEIIRELRRAGAPPTTGSSPPDATGTSGQDINGIVRALIANKFATTQPAAGEARPDNAEHAVISADTSRRSRSSTRPLLRSNGASTKGAHTNPATKMLETRRLCFSISPPNSVMLKHNLLDLLVRRVDNGSRRPRPAGGTGIMPVARGRGSLDANHWRAVARIGVQAAEALHYAHAQGTLHRDVKPGNLLVDAEGVVSVADFGLARAVDHTDVSRSGEVVGTLRYMAPEQLRGAADARSDVYALGLTLYELLTLRSAFEHTDRRRCLNGRPADPEPVPPRKIDQAIPRDLETIVLKCLAAEPSKRYQTAAALGADLRRFLEDKPIHARRASTVERAWRWCRRNPALAATSALAALLLMAVLATALTGHIRTRSAYAEARSSLARAEATSQLSLEVLDDIYLQLSPDRIWILSDADGGGAVCACLGLRSGDGSASSTQRAAMQVQVSEETASLLKGLLVFYDRLAEQASNDYQVMLQSAIASRRVGDIRQLLGQLDEAEQEYARAVEKFTALTARPTADAKPYVELARSYNEIGNVRSARFEPGPAYEAHRKAIHVLRSFGQPGELSAEYRYELARTFYLLANKHTVEPANRRGEKGVRNRLPERPGGCFAQTVPDTFFSSAPAPGPRQYNSRECRESAIGILEQLTGEYPNVPDYKFLLALCHRPPGVGPDPVRTPTLAKGRQRAIQILEQLTAEYPDVPDYRYELTATYAWIHVGLFPWQEPSAAPSEAERSLLRALDESQWLVAHNPAVPHYARSKTLILAKLGTICWRTGRLGEAEDFFEQAMGTQSSLVAKFSDVPSHNLVLLEFLRLRLAQVQHEGTVDRGKGVRDLLPERPEGGHRRGALVVAQKVPDTFFSLNKCRDSLETCIDNLTELTTRPELAEDRLAWSSLPVAYDTLAQVLARLGESQKAEEAKKSGAMIRSSTPDGRRYIWPQ